MKFTHTNTFAGQLLRLTLWAPLLLLVVAPMGCKSKRNHPIVESTFGDFIYEGVFQNFTDIEQFDWDTPHFEAFVEFEAEDFFGEVRVQIFDDDNFPIYDSTFVGNGGDLFVSDETDFGEPGEWIIIISSFHVDGYVRLDLF